MPISERAALRVPSELERRFVVELLRTGVGSTAAIAAGYSSKGSAVAAHKLLQRPHVQALLREARPAWNRAFRAEVARAAREVARRVLSG